MNDKVYPTKFDEWCYLVEFSSSALTNFVKWKFSHSYIFATCNLWYIEPATFDISNLQPLIYIEPATFDISNLQPATFDISNYRFSEIQYLKLKMWKVYTLSGWKNIGIRKIKFQRYCFLNSVLLFYLTSVTTDILAYSPKIKFNKPTFFICLKIKISYLT